MGVVGVVVETDVGPGGSKAVPHLLSDLHIVPVHGQAGQVPAQRGLVGPGVQEGSQKHVAGRPGERVHVDERHGVPFSCDRFTAAGRQRETPPCPPVRRPPG